MTNKNEIAISLNPKLNLDDKNNFQRFTLVEKNGNTKSRVLLFITNAKIREQIICNQFLSRYVQFFIEKRTGIKYISRDNPWDFELELSNSEKLLIEITSIADEVNVFKTFKYQERIAEKSSYKKIEFHELIKLNNIFPDLEIENLIKNYNKEKINKKDLVKNPHYGKKFIFESSISEDLEAFDQLLKKAIEQKVNKNHLKKEEVILIIDNRTVTFELESFINYLNNLNDYFLVLPFKEVWLYTGYYSDFDGNNAEYSLVPLKIEQKKLEKIKSKIL